MYDLFWFLVISFFIFVLPFKLWLTNEEKKDAVDMREHYKYSRSISQGAAEILAQKKVDAEIKVQHLTKSLEKMQNDFEAVYDLVYEYEDETQPDIKVIIDRLKKIVGYTDEMQ